MNGKRITFTQGDRHIETTLDEIRAIQAAARLARAESRARLEREQLKAMFWLVTGFGLCLTVVFMA